MNLPPIALFLYNTTYHTIQSLEFFKKNKKTENKLL